MQTYYEIKGNLDGKTHVLFGSYDREDCETELDCLRDEYKGDGYTRLRITSRSTDEQPDPEIYGDDFTADSDEEPTMQNELFTENFSAYACPGDSISAEHEGYTLRAYIQHDDAASIDDDDCHNTDQSVTGCDDEQQEKLLKARHDWNLGHWFYCGIVLEVKFNGVTLDKHAASLWAIECNYPGSDNSYLREVANELAPEALERAREMRAEILARLAAA